MRIAVGALSHGAKEWFVTEVHENVQKAAEELQTGRHAVPTETSGKRAICSGVAYGQGVMQRVRTERLPEDVGAAFTGLHAVYDGSGAAVGSTEGQQLLDLVSSHRPDFARAAQIDWRIMSHNTIQIAKGATISGLAVFGALSLVTT